MKNWMIALGGVLVLSTPVMLRGEMPGSREAARALTAVLDARKLDAAAAVAPEHPVRFIAALYYPGSQLLVLGADYPAPAYLEQRLQQQPYRDAYVELQAAAPREGRLFVMDLGADGLRIVPKRDEPLDLTYVDGVTQTVFNGGWKTQQLSEAEYRKRFDAQEGSYGRMLGLLTAALTGAEANSPSVSDQPTR